MSGHNYNQIPLLLEKTVSDTNAWDLGRLFSDDKTITLSFLNAHGVNTAVRNVEFCKFLLMSDHLLRDGIGVKLALKWQGLGETENLNGTDLIPHVLKTYKDKRLAIFGASDAALAACTARLAQEGVSNIVSILHGFYPEEVYINACQSSRPDIVVLCMGMPKQELLAAKLQEQKLAQLVICGGGWADFYSGLKKRAPLWIRKMSLEWLHRLASEPRRLGKRYTIDLLYFFYGVGRAYLVRQNTDGKTQ